MIGKSLTHGQMIKVSLPLALSSSCLADHLNDWLSLQVVRSMGLIDQPWVRTLIRGSPHFDRADHRVSFCSQNCPHGRPTMRHLLSLNRWEEKATRNSRRPLDWSSLE